jgi:hypothetical protein
MVDIRTTIEIESIEMEGKKVSMVVGGVYGKPRHNHKNFTFQKNGIRVTTMVDDERMDG